MLAHILNLAHGLGAALACAVLYVIAGLALTPARFQSSTERGETPAMIGAAAYVLVCWIGVTVAHVPLKILAPAFAAGILAIAAVRRRWVAARTRGLARADTLVWGLAFAGFYTLAYVFTMPPVGPDLLPVSWLGNIDLMTYIRYTKYVLHLGPSNLPYPNFSYLGFIYLQTPAVFYLLGALSFFFRLDPLTAAMPASFALAGLIALLASRIARSVFRLPTAAAVAIGAVLVCGTFFRYIVGEYFLSTLMSTPVALYVAWVALEHRPERAVDVSAAVRFASAYILLLFLYPLLLGITVGVHVAIIVLLLIAESQSPQIQSSPVGGAWRFAGRRLATMGTALAVIALVLARRVIWSTDEVLYLSQRNVNGWPFDLISPLAILGLPAAWFNQDKCRFCLDLEVIDPARRTLATILIVAIAAGMFALYYWALRRRTEPAQRALAALGGGAFGAYLAFYELAGVSYQQWKFASYSALAWSWAVIAALVHALHLSARGTDSSSPRRTVTMALCVGAVLLVVANYRAHVIADPAPSQMSAALRNLETLNADPAYREISVKMDETFDGLASWLALYLLPDKQVHVISERNDPREELSYDTISPQRPLLVQNFGCDGIGHDETRDVPGVGCLMSAPPSLTLNRSYPFNQTWWFVSFSGLGPREPGGRWNTSGTVHLELMADIRRAALFEPAYLNLQLDPYVPPGTPHQRIRVAWGHNRHADLVLDRETGISLRVTREDWTGVRMWTLGVTIELPDQRRPHPMYAPRGRVDDAPLAALFEAVSVTRDPTGSPVDAGPF